MQSVAAILMDLGRLTKYNSKHEFLFVFVIYKLTHTIGSLVMSEHIDLLKISDILLAVRMILTYAVHFVMISLIFICLLQISLV